MKSYGERDRDSKTAREEERRCSGSSSSKDLAEGRQVGYEICVAVLIAAI